MALEYHLFSDTTEEVAMTVPGIELRGGVAIVEHDTVTAMSRYMIGYIVANTTATDYVYNRRWRNLENGVEAIAGDYVDVGISIDSNEAILFILPHATGAETTATGVFIGASYNLVTLLTDFPPLASGAGSLWDRASTQIPLADFNALALTIDEDLAQRP